MPIPFHDADDIDELGTAGFLKIEASARGSAYLGGLFLVNARGEPLEFVYNRIETAPSFLWRPEDLARHAQRALTVSLFRACTSAPRLLLCLADEVRSDLFCKDIQVSLPVGRIGRPSITFAASNMETLEALDPPLSLQLLWYPGAPSDGSPERRLLCYLRSHELLLDPFERASVGLREVDESPEGESS